MAIELNLPDLGENIESADVVAVLVAVGDPVAVDQPVIEVEMEKATVEVPSTHDGIVAKIYVAVGDAIKVGQAILTLDEEGAKKETAPEGKASAGQAAEKEEKTAEAPPESNPASAVEPPTPVRSAEAESAKVKAPDETAGAAADRKWVEARSTAPASPSVRRKARELGIDINEITGTEVGGRISIDDVNKYAKAMATGAAPGGPAASAAGKGWGSLQALPDFAKWGPVKRERMSNVRRATASSMAHSWSSIPHVAHFDEADITDLESFRKRYGKRAEAAGGKLTITVVVLKVIAEALKRFPKFNASVDMAQEEIVFKKYVNIGIAVDTPGGLLVPVVRDADRKSIVELAGELTELAQRAREKKLALDDMRGANITLSNLGGLGTTHFTPIINWPESAIVGIGRAKRVAVCSGEGFEPRIVMPLSVSYDHRIIDGADAARFLHWIAEALERPLLLALD